MGPTTLCKLSSSILRLTRYSLPLASLVAACGGNQDGPNGADASVVVDCPTTGRYLPMKTGNTWTFEVTEVQAGTTITKIQTIGALEQLDGDKTGISAFRVTTQKDQAMVVSWQEDTGVAIHRHRELDMAGGTQTDETYDPYKARLDESAAHLAVGATWTDNYTELVTDLATGIVSTQDKTEVWEVELLDETVTVPAGTFCAMRVRRISTANTGGSDKTYWFARGVGKIKEQGATQLEQLLDYQVVE